MSDRRSRMLRRAFAFASINRRLARKLYRLAMEEHTIRDVA